MALLRFGSNLHAPGLHAPFVSRWPVRTRGPAVSSACQVPAQCRCRLRRRGRWRRCVVDPGPRCSAFAGVRHVQRSLQRLPDLLVRMETRPCPLRPEGQRRGRRDLHSRVGSLSCRASFRLRGRRFHSEVQHQPARGEARAAAVPSPGGVAGLPGRCKPCRALSAARRTQGGRSPTGGRRAADSAHLPSEPPPAAPERPPQGGCARAGRPRTG